MVVACRYIDRDDSDASDNSQMKCQLNLVSLLSVKYDQLERGSGRKAALPALQIIGIFTRSKSCSILLQLIAIKDSSIPFLSLYCILSRESKACVNVRAVLTFKQILAYFASHHSEFQLLKIL